MKLLDLLKGISLVEVTGDLNTEIRSVAYDSRKVEAGAVFAALLGGQTDGNRYAFGAIDAGARAVISELPAPWHPKWASLYPAGEVPPRELPAGVAWVQAHNARKALASVAANFYGRPAESLKLVGVTGTNGKTTTTYLIDSILRAAGQQPGLLGTIAYRTPRGAQPARNTTPESLDLQQFLAELRDAGATHAVLEVSSHALALDRVWACAFAVAVFTNLTRDHLDFHRDMLSYFAAKRALFEGTGSGSPLAGVVNIDDPQAKKLLKLAGHTTTYGLSEAAEVSAKKYALQPGGLEFTAHTPAGRIEVRSPLVGRINVYNILAAIGAALALEIPREAIEEGIRQLASVPGRFERVDAGQPFLVVVDYAHTDDALRNLLQTARELVPKGRVITVFGCGGDRDRSKRPLMGEAAGSLSDRVFLTSDNPRSEDLLRILNDAVVGLQKVNAAYTVEADRARAIALAVEEAAPGDIVLIAGKGHETYQILGPQTIHFDDREVARECLRQRGFDKPA